MAKKETHPWNWISELFESSIRPAHERKIGIEIENIGLWSDGKSLHYGTRVLKNGQTRIGAGDLLNKLKGESDWRVIQNDNGCPLGFSTPLGKVSLEPGSQLELSTPPLDDIPAVVENVRQFDSILSKVSRPEGLNWAHLGLNPFDGVDEMDVIPSTRYQIMTDYLGSRGTLGTSMMRLTASVQINLDYTSEAEAIEMLRVALAVAPVSYALFGNSPLSRGKFTGFLSYRRMIWQNTDPDRTGLLFEAFHPDFSFSSYAKQIWFQPLMFAQNTQKAFVPGQGFSLAELNQNRIPNVLADETNQWNAIREFFTEARLKPGYVEIRSIDGLRTEDRYAATAFWVGLLYSAEARKLAMSLLGQLTPQEREASILEAAKNGMKSSVVGRPMKEIARALLEAAKDTLRLRGRAEEEFLSPLDRYVTEGTNPSEILLNLFQGTWEKRTEPLVEYVSQ